MAPRRGRLQAAQLGQPLFHPQIPPTGGDVPPGDRAYPYAVPGLPFDVTMGPLPAKKSKPKAPKTKLLPLELESEGPGSNLAFQAAIANPSLVFSPQELRFLPSNYWLTMDANFGDLVTKFFQRKNNANCRFPHKLFNALALADHNPSLFSLIGVRWVTDRIFLADKFIFGRLLGINSIDGGLFHRQGNFPSHGFAEIAGGDLDQVRQRFGLTDVDQDRVRLLYHKGNMFSKTADEESVSGCKWITENEPRL
jgi:hypothetical protein